MKREAKLKHLSFCPWKYCTLIENQHKLLSIMIRHWYLELWYKLSRLIWASVGLNFLKSLLVMLVILFWWSVRCFWFLYTNNWCVFVGGLTTVWLCFGAVSFYFTWILILSILDIHTVRWLLLCTNSKTD